MTPANIELFRSRFLNYLKSGRLNRFDKVLSYLSPDVLYRKNAGFISASYNELKTKQSGASVQITVSNYEGNNPVANNIADYLNIKAGDLIVGAYVHGSVGTGEEVAYSDFDGLVILNDKSLESAVELLRAVVALKETERMMLKMDPLQHHGWFVLTEADLSDYPENYFPHELFAHSKCLFGKNPLNLNIRNEVNSKAFRKSFNHLSISILNKLENKKFLENRYVFKNFLSEFMLMPAIFLQARTGKGVFKKHSFGMAEKEIGGEFSIMNEISAMRTNWSYRAPDEYIRKLNTGSALKDRRSAKKYSGSLPEEVKNKFDDKTLQRMKFLVEKFKEKLK